MGVMKMFNWPLYKQGMKSFWKVSLIFFGIVTMYITIVISIFDPEMSGILEDFYEMMPEIMAMMGMGGEITSLNAFLVSYLYGFILVIFPMIFFIMIANNLVVAHTDRGSIAYLLATPNDRQKIIFTQVKVLGTWICLLVFYATILMYVTSQLMFPGELALRGFLALNVGLLLFHLALGGIAFLVSCLFNETRQALLIGAGLPVFFFIIQMLVNTGEQLENLKYLTLFTLFDTWGLINGEVTAYYMLAGLFGLAIILYVTAFAVFKKKDFSV